MATKARVDELVPKIMRGIEIDKGRSMALFMGEDPSSVSQMTDDQLIAWGRAFSFPEPTHCHECGQSLPTEA